MSSRNKSIASKYGMTWADQERVATAAQKYWHDKGHKHVEFRVVEEDYTWTDEAGKEHTRTIPVVRSSGLFRGLPT